MVKVKLNAEVHGGAPRKPEVFAAGSVQEFDAKTADALVAAGLASFIIKEPTPPVAEVKTTATEAPKTVAPAAPVVEKSEVVEEPASEAEPDEISALKAALEGKTVPQLKAYAKEEGFELTASKKDDIVAEIMTALTAGAQDA